MIHLSASTDIDPQIDDRWICCVITNAEGERRTATCCNLKMPDGKITHCELIIGDSVLILGEAMEGWPVHPLLAQLFVEDSDAFFNHAVKAELANYFRSIDQF